MLMEEPNNQNLLDLRDQLTNAINQLQGTKDMVQKAQANRRPGAPGLATSPMGGVDKGHSSRKNKPQRCSVCGGLGHKSRTCTMAAQQQHPATQVQWAAAGGLPPGAVSGASMSQAAMAQQMMMGGHAQQMGAAYLVAGGGCGGCGVPMGHAHAMPPGAHACGAHAMQQMMGAMPAGVMHGVPGGMPAGMPAAAHAQMAAMPMAYAGVPGVGYPGGTAAAAAAAVAAAAAAAVPPRAAAVAPPPSAPAMPAAAEWVRNGGGGGFPAEAEMDAEEVEAEEQEEQEEQDAAEAAEAAEGANGANGAPLRESPHGEEVADVAEMEEDAGGEDEGGEDEGGEDEGGGEVEEE